METGWKRKPRGDDGKILPDTKNPDTKNPDTKKPDFATPGPKVKKATIIETKTFAVTKTVSG
jgi:hypothetical protein